MDGLGPYSMVQVFTTARGAARINQMLRRGWVLLGPPQMCEEVQGGGTGTRRQVRQFVPYACLGRWIIEGEDVDNAQEDANDAANDTEAEGRTIIVAAGTDEGDPAGPVRVSTGSDAEAEAAAVSPPARKTERPGRRVNDGRPGTVEVEGLPAARG